MHLHVRPREGDPSIQPALVYANLHTPPTAGSLISDLDSQTKMAAPMAKRIKLT